MGNREVHITVEVLVRGRGLLRSLWEKQKTAKFDWSKGLTGSTLFTAKMEASMMSSTDLNLFLLLLVMHDAATSPPPGSSDQNPSARKGEPRLVLDTASRLDDGIDVAVQPPHSLVPVKSGGHQH